MPIDFKIGLVDFLLGADLPDLAVLVLRSASAGAGAVVRTDRKSPESSAAEALTLIGKPGSLILTDCVDDRFVGSGSGVTVARLFF